MALPGAGEVLGGRFRLLGVLGSGGTGVVWAAHDEQLGQRVAVKLVFPHLLTDLTRERLRREVNASRRPHPHAVTVFDLHDAGGLVFLSMELVEGPTLRQWLADRGRLEAAEVAEIGRQVASALAHLHEAGLVHRDVKPGNVLLSKEKAAGSGPPGGGLSYGVGGPGSGPPVPHADETDSLLFVKLCDLGLVRPLAAGATLTESAVVVGTPAYMAPEQGVGADLTGRTDVYALGITLYECLTGEVPLQGDTAVATLVQRQTHRVPRVRVACPTCPAFLDELLDRMLDPDPRRRPSATEVERTLATGRLRFRFPVKQLSTLLTAASLALGSWLGWQALRTPHTARVEAVGKQVRGVDERGRTTWSYQLENPVRQVEHADLDGDGKDETLVATWPDDQPGLRIGQLPLSEFLAVTRDGRVLTRVRPEELVTGWRHHFAKRLIPQIKVADLDLDDHDETVLNCRHRGYFPDELFVFWPKNDQWEWVLDHSGRVLDIATLPSKTRPALRFLAYNNPMGMQAVVGELEMDPPSFRTTNFSRLPLASPEVSFDSSAEKRWVFYVPIGERPLAWSVDGLAETIAVGGDGTTRLGGRDGTVVLDSLANPVPGPNVGKDLRVERRRYLRYRARLKPGESGSRVKAVQEHARNLEAQFELLLQEPPYRVATGIAVSQALASAGDSDGAVKALRRAAQGLRSEEIGFRLANLLAVQGSLDQAAQALRDVVDQATTLRGTHDALDLLFRIAIARQDPDEIQRCVRQFSLRAVGTRDSETTSAVLRAVAHFWSDQMTVEDCEARSTAWFPEGDAIACFARWRLGRTRPGDPEAMRDFIADTPDGAAFGRLALAASLLGTGQPHEATAVLDVLVDSLDPEATWDFPSSQLMDVAQALRARASLQDGDQNASRTRQQTASRHPGTSALSVALLQDHRPTQ